MKHVAPELDSLMWTLAEEGNERAIDEFGQRHPALRGELIYRIKMVKGLRSAGKPTAVAAVIPKFTPRESGSHVVHSRATNITVGALVFASIAAAAFVITTFLTPEKRFHKEDLPKPPPVASNAAPIRVPEPKGPVVNLAPIKEPDPVLKGNQSEASQRPTSVSIDHAPLLTVLQMMSEISGTQITSAPGMPNPVVDVDYHNMSAMEMLRDLGKRYAFTPLDQHDGSILVVPAVDHSGPVNGSTDAGSVMNQKIGG